MTAKIRLGLIGDNIVRSKSPLLHRTAGKQCGLDVTYERLIPRDLGKDFDTVFAEAEAGGYRGINITYPYKEIVAGRVEIPDPLVRAIGAVNTVIFTPDGPVGYNTDYSGFMAAYRSTLGDTPPGIVCLIGTGGVGKAVAFGLLGLGASVIRCVDLDPSKAADLAERLRKAGMGAKIESSSDAVAAAEGATGLINCTPIGMFGHEGTPLPAKAMHGARWAFDAVYTPVETQFLKDAGAAGLTVISGYELFFNQGIDAWSYFTGAPLDTARLRRDILGETL